MPGKNKKRAFSDAALREVKKEMAKPRIAESVRRSAFSDPRQKPRKQEVLA
jgi:ribosomal protein S21